MKIKNKVISVLLVFTLLFQVCLPVFASVAQFDNTVSTDVYDKQDEKIIGEVYEKREKNIKHFLKEDKTYEAVVYSTAVHYKEGNEWKDIDNSLVEKFNNEKNQAVLENKENSYKVSMAQNTMDNNLVSIKKGQYEISWNINNPQKSSAQIRPKGLDYLQSLSENERKKTLTKISSTVDYKEIYPNVDLSYDILADDVKENIIIKEKVKNTSFSFNIKLKNLVPELQENKSIIFYDQNNSTNAVFLIDAPYMYDASGEESQDIQVDLKKVSGGYVLTVTPNTEWINSSD